MPETALLPSPEELAVLAKLDPNLPAQIVKIANDEAQREYRYAVFSLLSGTGLALGTIGGFIYLVIVGHPTAASGLLGVGVLNLIQGFVRSRLRSGEASNVAAPARKKLNAKT